MITRDSHFNGDIYLPQIGASASSIVNDNNMLQRYIEQYEPELLKKGLGRKLYKEFKEQVDYEGKIKDAADTKWGNLLNGTSYVKSGITYYWRGLVEDSCKSITAYYIYYHYVLGKIRSQTTLGSKVVESTNSTIANPTPELIRAWRKCHEWFQGGVCNDPVRYNYKGVNVEDYFNSDDNSKDVSLHTFLSDNEVYDDWYFTPLENKNEWGL